MHLNAFCRYGWVVGVGRYIGQTKGVMFTRNEGQVRFDKISSGNTAVYNWGDQPQYMTSSRGNGNF